MKRFRRALLELWAILVLAAIVGFLGPFGTYLMGDFLARVGRWWLLLMGAYITMRPIMTLCHWMAKATRLPPSAMVFWGMVIASFPLAMIWRASSAEETRLLGGYSGLLSFALLCSFTIMAVVWWAEQADLFLLQHYNDGLGRNPAVPLSTAPAALAGSADASSGSTNKASSELPRIYARLSPGFEGEILALESEDHYVRVHGMRQNELLLLRLRDAIAEMDDCPGEQTHRSWWVARNAVTGIVVTGRNREIQLTNGIHVPVARDSVDRLRQSGFLPS